MPRNAKNWVFTSFMMEQDPADLFDSTTMQYIVSGKEIAPTTGAPHYQGFVQLKKKARLTALKRHFGDHIRFAEMKGTSEQAAEYCKKDGEFQERGDLIKCAPNVMTRLWLHRRVYWFMYPFNSV